MPLYKILYKYLLADGITKLKKIKYRPFYWILVFKKNLHKFYLEEVIFYFILSLMDIRHKTTALTFLPKE